jgi:hypothetical protein
MSIRKRVVKPAWDTLYNRMVEARLELEPFKPALVGFT